MNKLVKTSEHLHRDYTGAKLGMWLFLFTEILLFGGLFLLYAVYREMHAADFHEAGKEMSVALGAVNTVVLLTSSLTMVPSISALTRIEARTALLWLGTTIAAGTGFLVNKYFEWSAKIHHGLYPNAPELLRHKPGENMFFALYYAMTGLHAVHVILGMAVIGVMLWMVLRQDKGAMQDHSSSLRLEVRLENVGLYWHLVDVIWIFLFPLFYLIS